MPLILKVCDVKDIFFSSFEDSSTKLKEVVLFHFGVFSILRVWRILSPKHTQFYTMLLRARTTIKNSAVLSLYSNNIGKCKTCLLVSHVN